MFFNYRYYLCAAGISKDQIRPEHLPKATPHFQVQKTRPNHLLLGKYTSRYSGYTYFDFCVFVFLPAEVLQLSTLRGTVANLNTKKEELEDEIETLKQEKMNYKDKRNKWRNIVERILEQLASLINDATDDTEFCEEDPKEYDFVTFLHEWIDRYGAWLSC